MKDGIHPNYREVVFLDTSCDFGFVTRSTVATNETIKWKDGKVENSWPFVNGMEFATQLGLAPTPGAKTADK